MSKITRENWKFILDDLLVISFNQAQEAVTSSQKYFWLKVVYGLLNVRGWTPHESSFTENFDAEFIAQRWKEGGLGPDIEGLPSLTTEAEKAILELQKEVEHWQSRARDCELNWRSWH